MPQRSINLGLKKIQSMKSFLSLLLISILSASPAALAGGISSNGGDGIVSEFFDIARNLQKALAQQNQRVVDADLFAKTINSAKIYSQEKVFLGNKEVSAINTPALQEIYVSQVRWKGLAKTPKLKYVLVLHEFLGLMGYEDRTFSISNQLVNDLKLQIPQAPSSALECPKPSVEIAHCSLAFILVPGEEPGILPYPVEAALCGGHNSTGPVEFHYKVADQDPLKHSFFKVQDHYESADPKETAQLQIDTVKKQIKIIEPWLGVQTTSIYSCILW